jgi:hypothetical protein
MRMDFETALSQLQSSVKPLELFVDGFAKRLSAPLLYSSSYEDTGFRYLKPDVRHFCLLKAARVVSALNASINLARDGYTQEIAVLMRTVSEYTTHIEFVLPESDGSQKPEAAKYVCDFFNDSARNKAGEAKRAQVPQGSVHHSIGNALDALVEENDRGAEFPESASKLLSSVYRAFSNYVHAKYPEIMDLYGGRPGKFHLRGMRGTPKDSENLEMIGTFINTATLKFRLTAGRLNLRDLFQAST